MCRLLILCALIFISPLVFSWSEYGHILVAQSALTQLPQSKQNRLNVAASNILSQVPSKQSERYKRHRSWASSFAVLSAWPDSIRDLNLDKVFSGAGERIPPSLKYLSKKTSSRWHYSNTFYGAKHCSLKNSGLLYQIIDDIKASLKSEKLTNGQQVILLAFLAHLVADAYQPLHNIAMVDSGCQHDRGGNTFCLQGCKSNLHRYWDGGAGLFSSTERKQLLGELSIRNTSPHSKPGALDDELVWFVYSTSKNQTPSPEYQARAQAISQQKLTEASRYLSALLKDLYDDPR